MSRPFGRGYRAVVLVSQAFLFAALATSAVMSPGLRWFTAGAAALVALYAALQWRRSGGLPELAARLGMQFAADGAFLSREGFAWLLPEFGGANRVEFGNAMRRREGQGVVFLFDYRLFMGKGYLDFQAAALSGRRDLPKFILRPERLLDKLGALAGCEDIDFPEHPEFSRRYHLQGSDEAAVRGLFSAGPAGSLSSIPGLYVAGGGEWVVYCRRRHPLLEILDPADPARFLDEARLLDASFR